MTKIKLSTEQELALLLKDANLPMPVKEYRFNSVRKWRFDFAYIDKKIAIEIEGGVWIKGRHTRPLGYINDCKKYNKAQLLGWKILRYTPQNIADVISDLKYLFKK
jgi:very-short-patch-repair endonuclease